MNTDDFKSPAPFKPPPDAKLHCPLLDKKKLELTLIRLDEIHPEISGNKWFKLKENIHKAKAYGKRLLLSFGGAHSNHLAALAAAAARFDMQSIGLVRGLHGRDRPTPTLVNCRKAGMQLHFLSREQYAQKESPDFLKQLEAHYPEVSIIPEGGNNPEGRTGAGEIASFIPTDMNCVVLPVGTGTTLAGIRRALPVHQQLLGMVPFKQKEVLENQIREMLDQDSAARLQTSTFSFRLCNDYHFGGFAKTKPELIDFMNGFYQTYGVPLDIIYTGKMLYGLIDLIEKDYFRPGSRLCALHTGGLQGNLSRTDLVY